MCLVPGSTRWGWSLKDTAPIRGRFPINDAPSKRQDGPDRPQRGFMSSERIVITTVDYCDRDVGGKARIKWQKLKSNWGDRYKFDSPFKAGYSREPDPDETSLTDSTE